MKLMKARKKKKMNCKRFLPVIFLLFSGVPTFADSFADAIQDLAVVVACKGKYNNQEAGYPGVAKNYYVEEMMANRFAQESGENTMTGTFFGVCFNYAQFAFIDIQHYKSWYNKHGMYESQFWLAGVHDNPNQIELMSIGTKNDYSRVQNGVYIKTYDTSLRKVRTHNGATGHAWIWIERADGVWFWIDPTWTDTGGYVVYGYVKNGQEIQCRPDKKYCIVYPEYLNSLPLPPAMGSRIAPSKTANSTNRQETINDAGKDFIEVIVDKTIRDTFINVHYDSMKEYFGLMITSTVPFLAVKDKSMDFDRFGITVDLPMLYESIAALWGFDYMQNLDDENNLHAVLMEFDFARRLFNNFTWFIGGGAGLRFDTSNQNAGYGPKIMNQTGYLALKANTGFLINISNFFTRVELSYNNIFGFSAGAGIGIGLEM